MPRPVAILRNRPEAIEIRVARLGISKARQKRLKTIMDQAWAEFRKSALHQNVIAVEEKLKNASAAD